MSIKQERMAERIRQVLSELLMREVSDPRLQSVTITEVKVDPEIMLAQVYVNALGDEAREKSVMEGLDRAGGFLRRELSRRVRLRQVPELKFVWDATLERADRVERLLNDLDIPEPEPNDDEDFDFDLDDIDLDPYGDDLNGEDGQNDDR
jgi:ribosome-binding factor A